MVNEKNIYNIFFIITCVIFLNMALDFSNSITHAYSEINLSYKYENEIYTYDVLEDKNFVPVMLESAKNNNVLIMKSYFLFDTAVEYHFYSGSASFNDYFNHYFPTSKYINLESSYTMVAKPNESQHDLQFFGDRLVNKSQIIFMSWDKLLELEIPTPFVEVYGTATDINNWRNEVIEKLGSQALEGVSFLNGDNNQIPQIINFFTESFFIFFSSFLLLVLSIIILIHQDKKKISILKMHGFSSGNISRRIIIPYLESSFLLFFFVFFIADLFYVKSFNFLFLVLLLLEALVLLIFMIIFCIAYLITFLFVRQIKIVSTIKDSTSYIHNYNLMWWLKVFVYILIIPALITNISLIKNSINYYVELKSEQDFYSKISYLDSFYGMGDIEDQIKINVAIQEIYPDYKFYYLYKNGFMEYKNQEIPIVSMDYATAKLLGLPLQKMDESKLAVRVLIPQKFENLTYLEYVLDNVPVEEVLILDDYKIKLLNFNEVDFDETIFLKNPLVYIYTQLNKIENVDSFTDYYIIENDNGSTEIISDIKSSLKDNLGEKVSMRSLAESVSMSLYYKQETIKNQLREIVFIVLVSVLISFISYYLFMLTKRK